MSPTPQQESLFDWDENTPEHLVTWLERQYARHREAEDLQAAQLLKRLLAERAAPPDEQARLEAGKKQAKRLLKLAKQGPLELTALHQAQDVVARLHGYPDWQAWTQRIVKPAVGKEAPLIEGLDLIHQTLAHISICVDNHHTSDARDKAWDMAIFNIRKMNAQETEELWNSELPGVYGPNAVGTPVPGMGVKLENPSGQTLVRSLRLARQFSVLNGVPGISTSFDLGNCRAMVDAIEQRARQVGARL